MANQEHLDLIKQGIVVWNSWRKQYPEVRAYLIGANLREADLREADLNGAKLQEATYNTKAVQEKDVDGRPVTLEPTQWPQGFDPKSAGAIYDDC